MLTREKAIQQLVSIAVMSHETYSVAVLLSSIEEVKRFNKSFKESFSEVPIWLRPTLLRDTIQRLEFSNGKINFYSNPSNGRGQTLTAVYKSSNMTKELSTEYTICIIPCMAGETMIDFTEE